MYDTIYDIKELDIEIRRGWGLHIYYIYNMYMFIFYIKLNIKYVS